MFQHLYFYCNALADDVRASRSISSDSPAATRKVLGLCRALRTAGVNATVVSMGRGESGRSGAYHQPQVRRLAGIPIVYGPMLHRPIISQLLTMIWLVAMSARLARRRPGGLHLFYNQLTAYVPALVCLRLTAQRTAVDIEDGPVSRGLGRYVTRFGNAPAALYERLISSGALTACSALAAGTRIRPTMAYYGAVDVSGENGNIDVPDHGSLHVLYGGFLNHDTGVSLFVQAIDMMRESGDPTFDALSISIVGMGPGLREFRRFEGGRSPSVRVSGRASDAEYSKLIRQCHIGLSLKLIGGEMAETTFPSKTVEYAEKGLAVIATDISDVRLLFGDAVFYVERNAPEELMAHLKWALRNRSALADKAMVAQGIVQEQLSLPNAGRALATFLFTEGQP